MSNTRTSKAKRVTLDRTSRYYNDISMYLEPLIYRQGVFACGLARFLCGSWWGVSTWNAILCNLPTFELPASSCCQRVYKVTERSAIHEAINGKMAEVRHFHASENCNTNIKIVV